jgi:hypothetical protein
LVKNDSEEPAAAVFVEEEMETANSSKVRPTSGSSNMLETTQNIAPNGVTTDETTS